MIIRRLSYAIGAEITGIDLAKPLTDSQWQEIYSAWLEHIVLVFPKQKLDPEQLISFAGRFGPLDDHREDPASTLEGHREIFLIGNHVVNGKVSRTRDVGRLWHTDHSYTTRPTLISMLYCRALPPVGGTTVFSNMYMAYDMLSPKMKELAENLECVHELSKYISTGTLYWKPDFKNPDKIRDRYPAVVHPLVRTHPETGKKSLYLSEAQTSRFAGMTEEESRGLLQFLFQHAATPEFTYRHTYSVDDLVFWDNRPSQHLALADFKKDSATPRVMQRLTVLGEKSGRHEQPQPSSDPVSKVAVEQA